MNTGDQEPSQHAERIIEMIRSLWAGDAPPPMSQCIDAALTGDEQAAADALTLDAEERRRRDLPAGLDSYLSARESLATMSSVCRALLMIEVVARLGEPEQQLRDDLMSRLPQMAEAVTEVLSLCSMLHEMAGPQTPTKERGVRLGKYVLEVRLGAGAFGEAWQAFDTTLERHVALKILLPARTDDQGGVERVLSEARAAAALDHPSIVRVHEAGQFPETGECFIDSQLIGQVRVGTSHDREVRSLQDRIDRGPLPPLEAAALLAQVARGVAVAHARGITHRDIKPANILLGVDGRPSLADFGLSVTSAGRPNEARSPQAEHIAGTPAYMAPEVAMRQGATPLSDVYSLGATLRAALIGHAPFETSVKESGEARAMILQLVRNQPLGPVLEAAPRVPEALAMICDRATAYAPEARFASAERLAADLEAFLSHRPVSVKPTGAIGLARLWFKRNQLTGTVSLAAITAITIGTVGFITRLKVERDRALLAQVEAARQRDAAVIARDVVETMNQFVARTFNSARGLKGKADFTVGDAIQLAADRAGLTFADKPLVEASVRHFLGQSAIGSGRFTLAREQLERAYSLRKDLLGPTHRDTLATLRQRAELLVAEGKPTAADSLFEEIVRTLNEPVGNESPDMLRALAALGGKAYREQRSNDALPLLNRAVNGYRRLNYNIGADHQGALNVLVTIYSARGEHQKAAQTQREIVALNTASLGIDDISTLNAAQALAWVLKQGGSNDEARELYRDVTQRYQRVVGLSHLGTLHVMIELAALECEVDPAEALRIARLATELATPLATSSQYPLRARIVLGRALLATGALEEAEVTLRSAIEACTRERSASHAYTKEAARLLARVLDQTARSEAARLLREEYELKPADGP